MKAFFLLTLLVSCSVQSKRVIVIGDSLSVADSWQKYLSKDLPGYTFDNYAKAGFNTEDMKKVCDPRGSAAIRFNDYGYLIIMGGVNDPWGPAVSIENLKYIFSLAKYENHRIKIILVEYPSWEKYPSWNIMKQKSIERVYSAMYQFKPDAYVSVGEVGQSDGLHLNEDGKKAIAKLILKAIEK